MAKKRKKRMKKLKEKKELLSAAAMLGIFYGLLAWRGKGCPIKYLTGISCAGCGMTRAWYSALHLEFPAAFKFHPLFWMIPLIAIVYMLRKRIGKKWSRRLFCLMAAAFLTVYLIRLIDPYDSVVTIDPEQGAFYKIIKKMREIIEWLIKTEVY